MPTDSLSTQITPALITSPRLRSRRVVPMSNSVSKKHQRLTCSLHLEKPLVYMQTSLDAPPMVIYPLKPESDVYRHQILTSKVDSRAVRVHVTSSSQMVNQN